MGLIGFVLSQLPRAPARVLEVGCGAGELARALDEAGYDVTAIDPAAPQGAIFRRLKLDELDPAERFDAIVASRSLHHVTDLGPALVKIRAHLPPDGVLVLDEFGWDLLEGATAEWFYGQLRAAGGDDVPGSFEDCCQEWEAEHVGLHGYSTMREELDLRFEERYFSWEPNLYRYLNKAVGKDRERALIEAEAIRATAFRYAGTPRRAS